MPSLVEVEVEDSQSENPSIEASKNMCGPAFAAPVEGELPAYAISSTTDNDQPFIYKTNFFVEVKECLSFLKGQHNLGEESILTNSKQNRVIVCDAMTLGAGKWLSDAILHYTLLEFQSLYGENGKTVRVFSSFFLTLLLQVV